MEAFPPEDRAKDVKELDLRRDVLPTQRALGEQWNLEDDQLTFSVAIPEKPLTRRGVLAIVNSLYDPLGLVYSTRGTRWQTAVTEATYPGKRESE